MNLKKLIEQAASMKVAVTLLSILAVACAVATFIENDFGSQTARAVVYNHIWFETVIVLLGLNLIARIINDRMWTMDKLPSFIFHLSFVLVIIGAATTRYFGFEGNMRIREGSSANKILSSEPYLVAFATSGNITNSKEWKLSLSPLTSNDFEKEIQAGDRSFSIIYEDYYPHSSEAIVDVPNGNPFITMRVLAEGASSPMDYLITRGDDIQLGDGMLGFESNSSANKSIEIKFENNEFLIRSIAPIDTMEMKTQKKANLRANKFHPFTRGKLYTTNGNNITVMELAKSAVRRIVPHRNKNTPSALFLKVQQGGESRSVVLQGARGMIGSEQRVSFRDGSSMVLRYGSREIFLPFEVHLNDFVMQRYPGSMSASSYESHVTVVDRENNVNMPYHIYMNHILVYRGFRFYQSSFDQDEKGTILSVANDPGKLPTYIAYFLLTFGMLIIFIHKKSRFRRLGSRQIGNQNSNSAILPVLILSGLLAFTGGVSELRAQAAPPVPSAVPEEHAKAFADLLTLDHQGRLKPLDSLAMEVMNKIARTRSLYGLSYRQLVLSMLANPGEWKDVQLIHVKHPEVKRILGVPLNRKYVSFNELFDVKMGGNYIIGQHVNNSMRKPAAERGKKDKELLALNEKANIVYMIYNGSLFRIFPMPNDPQKTWYDIDGLLNNFGVDGAKIPLDIMKNYRGNLFQSLRSGNWENSDRALELLHQYQKKFGADIYPSDTKLAMERLFNQLNIFDSLTPYYMLIGLLQLIYAFTALLMPEKNFAVVNRISIVLHSILFTIYAAGLGLRWYASGHAPWSNGYESLIYIAWTVSLSGLVFARRAHFVLASTSLLTGISLFSAHLSWMDPQITNLVPVLKSYWLTIHVSIISASYGFFALGSLLGLIILSLFIIRFKSQVRIDNSIRELARITEMTLMVGLVLINIGNLLGAVWANESWGRYWSWDPKETWTLISILIYSAVGHYRFVPGLRSIYFFALLACLSFASILMTYFGVNFYLSGMHSYAAGDPVPVPDFVYYTLGFIFLIAGLAFKNRDTKKQLIKGVEPEKG